ncbi:ribonuclease HII [Caldinitratiruptor microaerophilus]|uniref:ribonuclease HII n=1 Tax=Caldinitratiruptor microaerophilus TaxID=671077 RepID=UPI0022308046|nr:ribonuclease HII [Caldinitratiruptor microaerophilus]
MEGRDVADLRMERVLWRRGLVAVAGVDEAGRGPLAGPVVAAAVVLAPGTELPGVDDSKRLTARQREEAYDVIRERALAVGIGIVEPERIDRVNIRNAALEAMEAALAGLTPPVGVQFVLVDGDAPLPGYGGRQRAVVGGDRKVLSVAAASIVAKVTRDRLALEWDRQYPQYGFARHKGYGTPEHIAALARWGPCPLHRRSFLRGLQVRLEL